MKYLIILTTFLYSCTSQNTEIKNTPFVIDGGRDVDLLVIDSCEYIRINSGNGTWGSHKGNCRFCKSRAIMQQPR